MRPSIVALALALVLPLPLRAADVVVQPGETLSEIAERAGVSLNRLMQLNGISDPDMVEAGRRLTLPGGSGSGGRPAATAARGGGGGGGGTVVVQPGETLSEIADRAGIGLSRLMQINGISDPDLVEAGRTLRLGGPTAAPAATATRPTYPRGASTHVVRPGESLSEIADGYGIPMGRLVALNGISDPNHLDSGSRLKLSGPVTTTASSSPKPAAAPVRRPVATS
ncbi:MAG: LysM peptidoglycan-binding domain-containing protein, partial [Prochlorococcaceae cyanobacterium]